jgi:hypothetical protein
MAAREYRNITGQTVWVPDAQLSGGISKVEADGIFTAANDDDREFSPANWEEVTKAAKATTKKENG